MEDRLSCLEGLDRAGVMIALEVALAERDNERERRGAPTELVWTGPEARDSASRDTSVVVRKLFRSAQRSVLIAGYAFDHGADILSPLHEAMQDRAVTVEMFLDLRQRAPAGADIDAFAAKKMGEFLSRNWPFGEPWPAIFYAPTTIAPDSMVSVHAKCIVVDETTTLITSANFTDRGQHRNFEVGVLLHDPSLANRLVAQWKSVLRSGVFRPYRIGS